MKWCITQEEESIIARMVAHAAPLIPRWNPKMKMGSRMMLETAPRMTTPIARIAFPSARITLLNRGNETIEFTSAFQTAALSQPLENYGRFHAKWHGDDPEPLPEPERQAIDWRVLHVSGRGRWCGMMLHVWNPLGSWWGEGDEKIYIDGEKFPSTFGTGSEDYFGYAWCNPTLFTKPYHAQSISENNAGHVSVNRFHISDQIPFQSAIEADIEKYFPNNS